MNRQSVALPWFPGFYNTELEAVIDQELEQQAEYGGEELEAVFDRYNFQAGMMAIAQEWVEAFARRAKVRLQFEQMESPKEYNFRTDRAFALIDPEEVKRIEPARHSEAFAQVLADWFTSRDGFYSFYSNTPDGKEWQKPVEGWDHNQISALLAAYVMQTQDGERLRERLLYDVAESEAAAAGWKEAA